VGPQQVVLGFSPIQSDVADFVGSFGNTAPRSVTFPGGRCASGQQAGTSRGLPLREARMAECRGGHGWPGAAFLRRGPTPFVHVPCGYLPVLFIPLWSARLIGSEACTASAGRPRPATEELNWRKRPSVRDEGLRSGDPPSALSAFRASTRQGIVSSSWRPSPQSLHHPETCRLRHLDHEGDATPRGCPFRGALHFLRSPDGGRRKWRDPLPPRITGVAGSPPEFSAGSESRREPGRASKTSTRKGCPAAASHSRPSMEHVPANTDDRWRPTITMFRILEAEHLPG